MRAAFINTLTETARENNNIFLLTADLEFSVFEKFREEFPGRFLNVGIAEQNMIGVASGLALSGKIVFVYSIIPFVAMRSLEQIRVDVCMQQLNVKIIGMGAGIDYSYDGPTHHAIEDISIMRSLPHMRVVSPGNPKQTEHVIKSAVENNGPFYIRLSKNRGSIESNEGKNILFRQRKYSK